MQTPQLDGLPFSIQILLSVLFGVAALGAAFKGYFNKSGESKVETTTTATLAAATLMDNMSIRLLSDGISHLSNDVVSLERAMGENTHWVRQKFEQDREICQRLRELREETVRLAEVTAERQRRERAQNVRRDEIEG